MKSSDLSLFGERMFLPRSQPNRFLKLLRKRRCFSYKLPTSSLFPIGIVHDDMKSSFRVQVVGEIWDSSLVRHMDGLLPDSIEELVQWIEVARLKYEEVISPETVRSRIDPAWFKRIQWFMEDGVIRDISDQESQRLIAAQESAYDKNGFSAFLRLDEVYIDPEAGLTCFLFDAELDRYFDNHCFVVSRQREGEVDYGIDQNGTDLRSFSAE